MSKPKTKRKSRPQRRLEAMEAVAREERELWELSELDQRILRNTLREPARGIYHPDAQERRMAFWDACDCLVTAAGPKKVAAREIRDLLAACASGGIAVEIRAVAALLLAKIATAITAGGDAGPATLRQLAAKLAFLEEEILCEVIDEFPPPQRLLFVLVCAPARFARDAVLARVPAADRSDAARIFEGDRQLAARTLDRLTRLVLP